jgi:hypothetical protein
MAASTAAVLQARANSTCLGRFLPILPTKAVLDAFADGFAVVV